MKMLGQLHVFCLVKLIMVVLNEYCSIKKQFKITIELNESGQKEPSLMIYLMILK